MTRRAMLLCAFLPLLLISPALLARDLALKDRIDAQRALERARYRHQIDAKLPFEEAVPDNQLERKVRLYLRQSAALERLWKTPVTAAALRREMERIAAGTLMPDRLEELYAALDRDPFLVQECLARPVLVDRLARNFQAFDATIQAPARATAERLHSRLVAGNLDPRAPHSMRTVIESGPVVPAPGRAGKVDAIHETREAFDISVQLDQRGGKATVVHYTVPKRSWDDWWNEVQDDFDADPVLAVAEEDTPLALPRASSGALEPDLSSGSANPSSLTCLPDDVWDTASTLAGFPDPKSAHSAVWTGSLMLIWGGATGGRYDPATDTWSHMSTVSAPDPTGAYATVWTGSEMIIWGGVSTPSSSYTQGRGARYDPLADAWTALPDGPIGRAAHTAVWTGSEMIVWGGFLINNGTTFYLRDGGRYNPQTNAWSAISSVNAPTGRRDHTAIWTGSTMVIWGGSPLTATGGRYDPVANTWIATTMTGAPTARAGHTASWVSGLMVIWGGNGDPGGRYDPGLDQWSAVTTTGAPASRSGHSAVSTGSTMIVWGGSNPVQNDGGVYDPIGDTWAITSPTNAPASRYLHSAVWTGSLMIVWGGRGASGESLNTGGRYDPLQSTWTPTGGNGSPSPRVGHTTVWTGTHMIVWGGQDSPVVLNTGGLYDPVLDAWSSTSVGTGTPSGRALHTAVWTGSRMAVWGGGTPQGLQFNDGAMFDPVSDSWLRIPTTDAPSARQSHSAVWTGTEMIVWGGDPGPQNTGGRYSPTTNLWTPMSTSGAPVARSNHRAVWTGSRMVVWGGESFAPLNSGGRYDPTTNAWQATSLDNVPSARSEFTVVWTGSRMIVWGGTGSGTANTGGRYDPVGDTWLSTSLTDAPSSRIQHSAVWTGTEMIIWGGFTTNAPQNTNTGGRYNPVADHWTATTTVNAPAARKQHSAVWTGSFMVVWGGGGSPTTSGGRYAIGLSVDDDGDGLSECQGDCNDSDPIVHDLPHEIQNLQWDMDGVTLSWDMETGSGTGTRYDAMYADLDALWLSNPAGAATCLSNDLEVPVVGDTSPAPLPGKGWFFLVRGDNHCGRGLYGTSPQGQDRFSGVCR